MLFLLFLVSCATKKQGDESLVITPVGADSIEKLSKTTISPNLTNEIQQDSLQIFANNEIISYCILLPLNEFIENFTDEYVEKAQHKFILKANPKAFDYIDVQGFIIDKENKFNPNLFYKRDIEDIQEQGLGIYTSYVDSLKNYYVIKGYLPNEMNKLFTQITWVKEDKVNVTMGYSKNKEAIWNKRIEKILTYGMTCNTNKFLN